MQDWPTGTVLDYKACRKHQSFSLAHTAYHSGNAAARMELPAVLWSSPRVEWGCDSVYETVMSVRQTRDSQCGWDWNTHAPNVGGHLSQLLLCQPYQQDTREPAIRNAINVPELNMTQAENNKLKRMQKQWVTCIKYISSSLGHHIINYA